MLGGEQRGRGDCKRVGWRGTEREEIGLEKMEVEAEKVYMKGGKGEANGKKDKK